MRPPTAIGSSTVGVRFRRRRATLCSGVADRPFRKLSDNELDELDDDALVAYLVAARDAGEPGEVKRAMAFLVYGRMDLVQTIVADRVPPHAIERVASEAMIETMSAVFDGVSVGQFV